MIDKDAWVKQLKHELQRSVWHQSMSRQTQGQQTSIEQQCHEILLGKWHQQNNHAPSAETLAMFRQVIEECIGLGPLASLIRAPDITEIMVNSYDTVFIERNGKLERATTKFASDEDLRLIIDRIVQPIGRRIDNAQPMVDARLPDGSRVNAVLSELATSGTALTIRKFSVKKLTFADLIASKALTPAAESYLSQAVTQRKNIIISGGTGSGKTTLLNILASIIPQNQRVITIEDAAELRLHHANLVSLEARPANTEGQGQISIRDLLINALRMRPDRIIVGECRGAEAIDMLQAMNTGHDGSLTTLHANSCREALQRLEVLVLMAGLDMPLLAVRQQIATAVDIIVQIARQSDGRRAVTGIAEVTGLDGSAFQLTPCFEHQAGQLMATGIPSQWATSEAHDGQC